MVTSPLELDELLRAGDRAALARALTAVEAGGADAEALIDAAAPYTGQAVRVGLTGPPGVGKSTLVELVALEYRRRGRSVGILAIDPTSALTGGALLGDRVRLGRLSGDPGVFVRSMASRGAAGGLAPAAHEAADLLDVAGYERVVVETVGVGQTDIEVAGAVHVVVLVLTPEAGDAVQGLKAGLLEIADIMVVNKADRGGAEELATVLSESNRLRAGRREVPVLLTAARAEQGVEALVARIEERAAALRQAGELEAWRRRLLRRRLWALLGEALLDRAGRRVDLDRAFDEAVEDLVAGRTTPRRAAAALVDGLGG